MVLITVYVLGVMLRCNMYPTLRFTLYENRIIHPQCVCERHSWMCARVVELIGMGCAFHAPDFRRLRTMQQLCIYRAITHMKTFQHPHAFFRAFLSLSTDTTTARYHILASGFTSGDYRLVRIKVWSMVSV
jgi:hypothetical protein